MSKKPNAQAFLAAMGAAAPEEAAPAKPAAPEPVASAEVHSLPQPQRATKAPAKPRRSSLKHFGGYLDDETLEQIALLRIRLKKDNSELIKLAIEDLYRKHTAKRAFGDA
ncbi:hypothetical protein RADP37_05434 (plasmid) [Roseomonas mucosa]|uniref:Uncharacterized protein n=1 Tax=Roseomonas mucosa TaxID=207340 RepID=A0A4Y1MPW5_9PROT|nr:hypothetical protein RADP37_05489 [Roseomonas mucosa]AWV20137.1 hypothetical protein RADP37_05434 [Roseomonas mucosa]